MHFDLYLFELYTRGYLEAGGRRADGHGKEYLPWGAKLMTLECGIRFLTDYLQGDTYFKVSRARQNLSAAAPSSSWWRTWKTFGTKWRPS